jgi:hypothetical protein
MQQVPQAARAAHRASEGCLNPSRAPQGALSIRGIDIANLH